MKIVAERSQETPWRLVMAPGLLCTAATCAVLSAFVVVPAPSSGVVVALVVVAGAVLSCRSDLRPGAVGPVTGSPVLWRSVAALAVAKGRADGGEAVSHAPDAEARLRNVIESSDDIIFEFDQSTTFVNVWARDESLLARPKAELIGRNARDVLDPRFVAGFEEIFRRVLGSGRPEVVEYPLDVGAGRRWFGARVAPLREPDGTYRNILMFVRDITERKHLDARAERLAAVVEATTDLVCLADTDGAVLYLNHAGRKMVRLDDEEATSTLTLVDLVAESAREEFVREALPGAVRDGSWTREMPLRAADGTEIPASQLLLAHRAGDNQPQYFSLIVRDLTERNNFEAELRQSQKMEAIGNLAGGIAHDFNNLLSVVQNYAYFVMDELPEGDPARADLEEIVKAGERGATLTRQLLAFSRQTPIAPEVVDVNTLVGNMHSLLSRGISESIEIVTDLSPEVWRTEVDPGQMEQVLLNLAVNAKDAMLDGGTLTIRTSSVEAGADVASVHPGMSPGRYVRLEVADTGCGMSAEVKDRIFDPFFTTKPPGEGTGLGLASVYGIVSQAGGCVHVDSEEGRGSTFTIHLPAAAPEEAMSLEEHSPPEEGIPSGRGETVLVAEDEEVVRAAIVRVLFANGYRVLEARSGVEALDLAGVHEAGLDLLITDAVMPGMSGAELAEAAGLPTVYISGYPNEVIARQGLLDEDVVLVKKPFTPGDLLRTIRRVLDQGSR